MVRICVILCADIKSAITKLYVKLGVNHSLVLYPVSQR